ncbi:MAG: dodecin domain-containing protein [Acidimicrobiia bacterium]|nr:dodecin domain-containing protein [Acidimicrobiia bacterium]
MSESDPGALKIIEITGRSTESFEAAIQQAVAKAAESIAGIASVEVLRQTADVENGRVSVYNTTVKLSFLVR